ncbi:MAG: hypothetical protein HY822_19040 [Acidobacteria bacterium]|nr:hypothetical protein [Acidobacteriota bacterium]
MLEALSALGAAGGGAGGRNPEKIRAAAGEFEALLIGSLLKSMREAGSSGWLGGGQDQASDSLLEIAEQQMARLMAAQGGLGLARLVASGLSPAPGSRPQQVQLKDLYPAGVSE